MLAKESLSFDYRRRFAAVLDTVNHERAPYDEVLHETDSCLVAPTLGSIVPHWVLLIPRYPSLNFVEWRKRHGQEPLNIVRRVSTHFDPGAEIVWFEHGPSWAGSPIGCGLDYAHLHILLDPPFTFEAFRAAARTKARFIWQEGTTPYGALRQPPYLAAGNLKTSIFAERVDDVPSQFFRRIVAALVGKPDKWNYREFPYIDNVEQTLVTLRR